MTAASTAWLERVEALALVEGLERFPTPLLAVDLDTLERNLATMAAFFESRSAWVRPHVKTHKSTAIARLQVAAHGRGVTCSTTDEVVAMVGAGITDVLLANVVSDPLRAKTLAEAARAAELTVAADSTEVVELLAREAERAGVRLGVVIECDIGMGRNGVTSLAEGVRLGDELARARGLELRGVMAYEGHLVDIVDPRERAERSLAAMEPALELLHALRDGGHSAPVFTGSSTATYDSTGALAEMTDVQTGTYVLMDETYRVLKPEFEPAMAVIATVLTSRPDGTVVLDIGAKRLGTDWGDPRLLGAGATFRYTAEEHSIFAVTDGERPRVGQRVAMLPGHACTTMSYHGVVYACRAGRIEKPFAIDARDPRG